MKKIIFTSSLTLSLIASIIPNMANAAGNVSISNVRDSQINIPGVKIDNKNNQRVQQRERNNRDEDEVQAPPPGSQQMPSGTGMPGGVQGAKPVNVPEGVPQSQNIQMQSYNDVEEKAVKKSQGQIPYEPPHINKETIQKWNTTTIGELEAQGQANAQRGYSEFRMNPHGHGRN